MSDKLPVISGKKLILVLKRLGYEVRRQRGSHVRLEKQTSAGCHKITIPDHNPIARGTLSSIVSKVVLWNQMDKKDMLNLFRR